MLIKKRKAIVNFVVALVLISQVDVSFSADPVGSLAGAVQVDAGGQAAWNTSIQVAPGVAGLAPQIDVSVSASGKLAVSTGSSITRCATPFARDSINRPVRLDSGDAFCMGGSPLVEVATNEYRTEIESFQKITSTIDSNTGEPSEFTLQTKTGNTITFGGTVESKISASNGVVVSWQISAIYDQAGNGLWYDYQNIASGSALEIQLSQIQYGSKTKTNANSRVVFNYENKPDQRTGYSSGIKNQSTQRLASIESLVTIPNDGERRVRLYNFNYNLTEIGGYSRIDYIDECVSSSQGDICYRPTSFSYSPLSDAWQSSNPSVPNESLQNSNGQPRGTLLDVNGDGRTDWVIAVRDGSGLTTRTWLKNSGTGFTETASYALTEPLFDYVLHADGVPTSQLVDINADGLVDVVSAYEVNGISKKDVYFNTGSGFALPTANAVPSVTFSVNANGDLTAKGRFVDVNGDALPDFVQSYRDSSGLLHAQTWLNQLNSWAVEGNYLPPAALVNYQTTTEGIEEATLFDINGDGLLDFVMSVTDASGVPSNQTWLNTGSGWSRTPAFDLPVSLNDMSLHPNGAPRGQLVDLNGDGLADVVSALDIVDNGQTTSYRDTWLNTGLGFVPSFAPPGALTRKDISNNVLDVLGVVVDVDNDGHPEFVHSYEDANAQTTQQVWVATASVWQSTPSLISKLLPSAYFKQFSNANSASVFITADIDGDGNTDVLISTPSSQAIWSQPSLASGEFAGFLNQVVNGLGLATRIDYGLSTDSTLAELGQGVNGYPNIADNSAMILVKTVSSMDGLVHPLTAQNNTNYSNPASGWYQVHHQYGSRKVNVQGRGSLGFSRRVVSDNRTNIDVTTTFLQIYPFAGKTDTTTSKVNGQIISESFSLYQSQSLNNGETTFTYPSFGLAKQYDQSGTFISSKLSESRYDDGYGNLTFTRKGVTSTNLDINTVSASTTLEFESSSTTSYSNNTVTWLLGLAQDTTSTYKATGQPTLSNHSTATYNARGQLKEQTLEPGNAKSVRTIYTYDTAAGDFGNVAQTRVESDGDSRTESVTFTAEGKFPTTKTNAIGHTGTVSFDYRWGKPKRKVDANSLARNTIFDEFGTVLREEVERPNAPAAKESAIAYWCEGDYAVKCTEKGLPTAVYFVAAFDDQGQSPQTVYYDGYGRELFKWTMGAEVDGSEAQDIYIRSEYDSQGRKIKESTPSFSLTTFDYSIVRYDSFGAVYEKEAPDGVTSQFANAGLVQTITNAKGQIKRITSSLQGKPIEVIDGFGSADASKVEYTYDAKGALRFTESDDRTDTVIELRYHDKFGYKIYMDDPDMGVWTYEYDGFGQLERQTDAKSQTTDMAYDDLGRMVTRIETDDNNVATTTTWVYDTAPLGSGGQLARGMLHTVTAPHSQYSRTHEYDQLGRAVKETTSIRGQSFVSERAYYRGTDRIVWEKYPSGLAVTKEYDSTGYPKALKSVDLPSYQSYLEQSYLYQDIVAHAEQFRDENDIALDFHQAQFEDLEDDVQTYVDDINGLIGQASYWQSRVSRTAAPLNEHSQWSQDYHAEYLNYYNAYQTNLNNAIAQQSLAQPHLTIMDAKNALVTSEWNTAQAWLNLGKSSFHAACKAAGWELHTAHSGMPELADACAFGPEDENGNRISELALGNNRKLWCTNPNEFVPWNSPSCNAYSEVFAWMTQLDDDLNAVGAHLIDFEAQLNNYNNYGTLAELHSQQAEAQYALAQPYLNAATYWEGQAQQYVNGMNIYGAITASHSNIAEGFNQRYSGYLTNLESYAGAWACVDTSSYTAPAIPAGQRIMDDDWGDIVINHQSQELHRIPTAPEQEHCGAGKLWVLTQDGQIQTKQAELTAAKVGLQRDYHQYKYSQLIDPYNNIIEAANAFYDGSLVQGSDQYNLLLSITGATSLHTDGIEPLEQALNTNGTTYWQATAYMADGQIKDATFGNGVENSWQYDQRGRSTYIKAETSNTVLQQLSQSFDVLGNLNERQDLVQSVTEIFTYDTLNRLKTSTLSGTGSALYHQAGLALQTFSYNALGNLTSKSDVGTYTYGQNGAGPHAVTKTTQGITDTLYHYDANGNQLDGNGRTVTYAQYNKPQTIIKGANQNDFDYGPERQMIWQQAIINSQTKQTTYAGRNFEQENTLGTANVYDIHHLKMGKHTIAVLKTTPNLQNTVSTHYLHQDHLDSIVMITDENGEVVERNHYDAFGQLRNGILDLNQQTRLMTGLAIDNEFSQITDRGYTTHRQLKGVDLIHMGGRVFDPHLGRFLSADPNIQAPLNSQSLNRYSYVLNNPLSMTDPTGYFFSWLKKLYKKALKIVKRIIKKISAIVKRVFKWVGRQIKRFAKWVKRNFKEIIMVAVSVFVPGGALIVMAYNAAYTLNNGGSLWDVLKAAAISIALQGSEILGKLGKLGSSINSVVQATGIRTLVTFIGSSAGSLVSFAGSIVTAAVTNGVVQSIYTGITAKILGGSFSRSFRDSIGVSVVSAGISEYLDPTPPVALNKNEKLHDHVARTAYPENPNDDFGDYHLATDAQAQNLGLDGSVFSYDDGMQGVVYTNGQGHYVVGYAGSNQAIDWLHNAKQSLGFESSQYERAFKVGEDASSNVSFAGHSLGGGLASASASGSSGYAFTLNAAGLHSRYRGNNTPIIRAIYSHNDVLSLLQDLTPLPNAVGTRIGVSVGGWHGSGQLCRSLQTCN